MDIIASMLAYLGCVTGVIGALAISFFVVLSTPRIAAPAHQAVAVAASRPPVARTIAAAETKPASQTGQRDEKPTPHATEPRLALDVRQKTRVPHAQARRIVQEERARRWAYQQSSDFDSRFLGYAD